MDGDTGAKVRRRGIVLGAGALFVLGACRRTRGGETLPPESLPEPPPSVPSPSPPALAVVGPGVRVALRVPVHIERMTDDPLAPVRIVGRGKDSPVAMLWPAGDEPPPVEPTVRPIGEGAWLEIDPAADFDAFFRVEPAPRDAEAWRLEHEGVAFAWPAGLVVDAQAGEITRVELRRTDDPRDVMVVLRGPLEASQVPALDELSGPGQREAARDASASPPWIELHYALGGDRWRQRHHRFELPGGEIVLVTAQATEVLADRVLADGDALARSLRAVSAALLRPR